MNKFIKISSRITSTFITIAFMFIPESLFEKFNFCSNILNISNEINIIINRVLFLFCIIFISMMISLIYMGLKRKYIIKGKNYIVQVEYGDIVNAKKCKKVIDFDECYTDTVIDSPTGIGPTSICGQYLLKNPNIDIKKLIGDANLKQCKTNSKFQNKVRYESGTLVPNGDDLLMAFAKLDVDGTGKFFSYQEYMDCLSKLWKEIDKYYGQKDVCIPILGGGRTRISDYSFTQQELLDIIIMSYKLSQYKIKKPYKLRIICKENEDFSLNKIGESI